MSGWFDWIEDEINCPFCEKEFLALFCEDGNPHRVLTQMLIKETLV